MRTMGNMVSGTHTKTFFFPFSNKFPLSLVPETLQCHETVTLFWCFKYWKQKLYSFLNSENYIPQSKLSNNNDYCDEKYIISSQVHLAYCSYLVTGKPHHGTAAWGHASVLCSRFKRTRDLKIEQPRKLKFRCE